MKKFIRNALLFCLLPLPVLYLLSYMVDKGLQKSRHEYYADWNDLYSGHINADALVMGASRAYVHVSPQILDSVLHINSYNLGMDGTDTRLQFERLKIYLRHNKKPKYILLEVDYITPFSTTNALPGVQQFLPYLHDTAIWRIVTTCDNPLNVADRYFPLFKYNNEPMLVKEGLLSFFNRGMKGLQYKGYQGRDKAWDNSFENFEKVSQPGSAFPIHPAALADLGSFLSFCKTDSIKVIFFYAPLYSELLKYIKDTARKQAILDSFSRTFDIPVYNYLHDTMCADRGNFYNSMHMNRAAAERFSLQFANDLKKEIPPTQP